MPINKSNTALALLLSTGLITSTWADQNQLPIMLMTYKTGPYAVNGTPFAAGFEDAITAINQTGGLNGEKIKLITCETGYKTKNAVACYQKHKSDKPLLFHVLSTGASYALEKSSREDKIPLLTIGYGIESSAYGPVFEAMFPLGANYYAGTTAKVDFIAKELGGYDKLKGKQIVYLVHKSIYGTGTKPVIEDLAKKYGFKVTYIQLPHPGTDLEVQSKVWKQIKAINPDYVFFRGWGKMNPTTYKQAYEHGYPLNQMIGVWWSGNDSDVQGVESEAKGLLTIAPFSGDPRKAPFLNTIKTKVIDKGLGASKENIQHRMLYLKGVQQALYSAEAIKLAQKRSGSAHVDSKQVMEALENMTLSAGDIKAMGAEHLLTPLSTSCEDHEGGGAVGLFQWDGKQWVFKDSINPDRSMNQEIIKKQALQWAEKNKIPVRDCKS